MRFSVGSSLLYAASLMGCSQPPPPAAPSYNTTLTMKQLMEWVIDAAADEVWESVAIIITEKGENHKVPKTDEEWAKVRAGAATLVESGNLLMMQGRARDEKWLAAAKRMSDAAMVALKAAERRDVDALFDSGATIYNACSACHSAYRVGDDVSVAPSGKPQPDTAPAKAAK
jgi:hypothetical protein